MTAPAVRTVPGCGRPHSAAATAVPTTRAGAATAPRRPRSRSPAETSGARRLLGRLTSGCGRARSGDGAARARECGGPAAVWCYDGADPAERTDPPRPPLQPRPGPLPAALPVLPPPRDGRTPRPRPTSPTVDATSSGPRGSTAAGASARGIAALLGRQPGHRPTPRCAPAASRSARVGTRRRRVRTDDRPRPRRDARRPTSHRTPRPAATISTTTRPTTTTTTTTSSTTTTDQARPRSPPDQNDTTHQDPRATTRPVHRDPTVCAASPDGPAADRARRTCRSCLSASRDTGSW